MSWPNASPIKARFTKGQVIYKTLGSRRIYYLVHEVFEPAQKYELKRLIDSDGHKTKSRIETKDFHVMQGYNVKVITRKDLDTFLDLERSVLLSIENELKPFLP